MMLTRQESARAKLLTSVRLYSHRKAPCFLKSVQPRALNPKHLSFKCFANVNATVERPVPQNVEESLLSYDKEEYADPPTFITTDGRVVAVGDLHGDYQKTIECLTASKVISINSDNTIHWIGKNTVVVQLGDVLGRGPDEICILQLLRYLDACARREGGAVYMLNGNHEFMNVCGSFKYVHNLALQESGRFAGVPDEDLHRSSVLVEARARLFKPGGALARDLSRNPTVLVVNDTVFAHGALFPEHVEFGLEKINSAVSKWMRGDAEVQDRKIPSLFLASGGRYSIMWSRIYSSNYPPEIQRQVCHVLREALSRLRARRLVVGHTIQPEGINCVCDGGVWRIDVGMSLEMLNRPAEWLEIRRVALTREDPGNNGSTSGESNGHTNGDDSRQNRHEECHLTDEAGSRITVITNQAHGSQEESKQHQLTSTGEVQPPAATPHMYQKIQFEPQLQVQHPHHHNHHNLHEEQQDSPHHASRNHAAKTSSSLLDPIQPGIGSGFLKEHREPVDSVGVDGEDLETIISVHGDRSSFDMLKKEVEAAAML